MATIAAGLTAPNLTSAQKRGRNLLNQKVIAWLFIPVIACLQYGYNLYLSMATAGLLLLLLSSHHRRTSIMPIVPLIAFFISFLWNFSFTHPAADFNWLRETRLALLLAALIYIQKCELSFDFKEALIRLPWVKLTLALSLLATLQYLAALFGQRIVVPSFMFINSDDVALAANWATHAEEHDLIFSIRPSSLYSEPSYFGLILLFLHVIILFYRDAKTSVVMSILIILTSAIISSGFAIVSNIVIAVFHHNRSSAPKLLAAIIAFGIAILALSALELLPQRLLDVIDGNDVSTNVRLIQPLKLLIRAIIESPFGFPATGALSYFVYTGDLALSLDKPFQNGLLNLVLSFGLLSPIVLAILFSGGKSLISKLFIFFALVQNGNYSEIDKVFLISLVCLLVPSVQTNLATKRNFLRDKIIRRHANGEGGLVKLQTEKNVSTHHL